MYNEIRKMVQVSHCCLTGKAALPYKTTKNGTLVPKMITLKLQETLENLPAELRKAGTWVLEHQVEAATMSLRGIARAAGVHPNSVTRLTESLAMTVFRLFVNHCDRVSLRQPTFLTKPRGCKACTGSRHVIACSRIWPLIVSRTLRRFFRV